MQVVMESDMGKMTNVETEVEHRSKDEQLVDEESISVKQEQMVENRKPEALSVDSALTYDSLLDSADQQDSVVQLDFSETQESSNTHDSANTADNDAPAMPEVPLNLPVVETSL